MRKQYAARALGLVLTLVLLLSTVLAPGGTFVSALEEEENAGELSALDSERFWTDRMQIRGFELSGRGEERIELSFRNHTGGISFAVGDIGGASCNAVRIVLAHASGLQAIRLEGEYGDGETVSVSETVESQSGVQSVILPVSRAEQFRNVTLYFDSTTTRGSLTLYSIQPVNLFFESVQARNGALTRAWLDENAARVYVQGYVTVRAAAAYPTAQLCLYVLRPEENPARLLQESGRDPDETMEITTGFTFSVPVSSYEDRMALFMVCIRTETGETIPIDNPCMAQLTQSERPKDRGGSSFLKGILSEQLQESLKMHPACAVIDVDVARLFNAQNGELTSYDNYTFYFSRDYMSLLQSRARQYELQKTDLIVHVYMSHVEGLTLTDIGKAARTGTFASLPAEGENASPKTRALSVMDPDARMTLYAIVEKLAQLFPEGSGYWFGNNLDDPISANESGTDNLADYTVQTALSLCLFDTVLQGSSPGSVLYVPISDRRPREAETRDALDGKAPYNAELFTLSLSRALDQFGGGLVRIRFLICSTASPYGWTDASDPEYGTGAAQGDRIPPEDAEYYGQLTRYLNDRYASVDERYLWCWTPGDELHGQTLQMACAVSFYKLMEWPGCTGMILNLSGRDSSALPDLRQIWTYIDATDDAGVLDYVIETLGQETYDSLFRSVDLSSRRTRIIRTSEAVKPDDINIVGSYICWNFSDALSTRGWNQGLYVDSFSLGTTTISGRSLRAQIDCPPGQEASLVADCTNEAFVTAADYLEIVCGFEGTHEDVYEILVDSGTKNDSLRTTVTVRGGGMNRILVDIRSVSELDYIRLYLNPVGDSRRQTVFCVEEVTAFSETLDSDAFEALVRKSAKREEAKPVRNLPALLVVGVAMAGVLSAAVALIVTNRKKS
ncbi:MAG: hypothetical protein IJU20_08520 [Clostridia bacterium]|nr:hypothetical protein [Clostridia bacterium]